ncbi:MAG: C-terminal binding protein [Arenicellales bacterium]|jgi:D-3-phosphoglycerate dehydrogenase|nr:C-terminal binding protein [Arenicellales bacterium]
MKVLLTDYQQADAEMECALLLGAGIEVAVAQCHSPDEVIEAAYDADALVVQYAPITRAVIEALPNIRLVTINAVGVDSIDVDAAREHGVWVCNVPDASVGEVATHALAMALSLIRHLPSFDQSIRAGNWQHTGTGELLRPAETKLGILGFGRIGQELARLATLCFGEILAHDPFIEASRWPGTARQVSLETLFVQSDIVSLHLPLTVETRNIVSHDLLGKMKHGSYLVNVSRGGLLDVEALIARLDDGQIALAALDVLPNEPPAPGDAIVTHNRVLLSPHAAYYSVQSDVELRRKAVNNVISWYRAGHPTNVVVAGRDPRWF